MPTIDGDVSEWAASTRLDGPGNGMPGYAMYGDLQGGVYTVAITTDGLSIGPNTTIWIDADLDRSTGYKIWGWAGGAEYNVNFGADGVARLYSGAAGQTLVGAVDYALSADGATLELAIDGSLMGSPNAVRIYSDVNDSVFLPNDYALANYIIGAGPPAVIGGKTLDGDISEWAASTRLDGPGNGMPGYAMYGDLQGGVYTVAITTDGLSIGPNTTIWIDADLDRSTGYQIWGTSGGAEYNVNFGADGVARLYSGATLIGAVDYGLSADGATLELAIDGSLMGAPSGVRIYSDVNDSVFLPNDYALANYIIGAGPPAVVGGKTLDGDVSEWAASTRLDGPGNGMPGYAMYGDLQGGVYTVAITTDGLSIGPNTTIWIDADLDRATGYLIWGWSGGAEYNVNFGADGVARLYSGAAGQTLIGAVDYGLSADGATLELAIDGSLMGSPNGVRIYSDVNDSVYLPNDYALADYIIGAGPPAVIGGKTLDGDVSEWAASTRLDGPGNGMPGYAMYGDLQGGVYTVAITTDGLSIGPNTTIWIDADLDRSTGYQIFGLTGGAEYNVNFGADGVARLYSGAAGQTLVGAVDYGLSADGATLELAIDGSLMGAPSGVRIYSDVNDSVFLPNDYALANYIIGAGPPAVVGGKTLDGDVSEWAASTRLDGPGNGMPGYAMYGDLQGGVYTVAITTDGLSIGPNTTIWIDADLDRATGYLIWGWSGGAEYNVNFGADGVARLYSGAAGQTLVGAVDYALSADGATLELAIDGSLMGSPNGVRIYSDVNDSVYLPNDYALADYIIGAGPPAVVGGKTLDGDLGEWTASMRLDGSGYGVSGYAIYGDLQGGVYTVAITTDGLSIGPNTTIWIDADLDRSTGYQIFGLTGGAEYNVNFGADGVARLYSGAAGQTLVGAVDYGLSADGATLELAIDGSLMGAPSAVRLYSDVNDSVFLPNDYALANYVVGAQAPVVIGGTTLDGVIDPAEWLGSELLFDTAPGVSPGYSLYGAIEQDATQGGVFVMAIESELAAIGPNTTIWIDADRDAATGYQIWGWAGGAEYNINIGVDGLARLYSGAAGATFVADLDFRLAADGSALEVALPQGLMAGTPSTIRVLADVNDQVFLPDSYTGANLVIQPAPAGGPVDDPQLRIGIVYSDTTAANYYNITNYGQLFMAMQNQAMQAGIPFDLLTEADLLDSANLAQYDALVFPGFSHVKSADVDTIAASLAAAQSNYGVGLIAAGNFLTNDETGAAIPGNSYARMSSLLGVTLEGSGQTNGFDLVATGAGHPILAGYANGQLVGAYGNTSYQNFIDTTGTGQVLFNQVVTTANGGTASHDAVIATQNAARNVHFGTDAIIGNNNILGEAIDWVSTDNAPDVSLLMTRGSALFYSRNDMDQSQETYDVSGQNPGIYDVMLPIIEKWYDDWGFVGSYYVNVGANPPNQLTDWTVSKPYYDAIRALESEIGSHSYTIQTIPTCSCPTRRRSSHWPTG